MLINLTKVYMIIIPLVEILLDLICVGILEGTASCCAHILLVCYVVTLYKCHFFKNL